MAKGHVTLRGRFSPGTVVALVKVSDETVLRSQGGKTIERKKVDKDGCVEFSGAEVGARYFVTGIQDGFPLEVRARGRAADDPSEVLSHSPVTYERRKLADGSWLDEDPDKVAKGDLPPFEGSPHLDQRQLADDVVQRSNTPRGSAHPHDPEEPIPYPSQESEEFSSGKVLQMSDTETGMATPIDTGPQRQEDVPSGTWQRSDTPTGVATILPSDPLTAQESKESSEAKAMRGSPQKAAADPLPGTTVPLKGKPRDREDEDQSEPAREGENTSGLDALGQPVAQDVAAAAGVEPAKRAAEDKRKAGKSSSTEKAKSEQSKKDRKAVADAAPKSNKNKEK